MTTRKWQIAGLVLLAIFAVCIAALAWTRAVPAATAEVVGTSVKSFPAATPSPTPTGKKVVFIGDSYAQGTGASAPTNRWASKLSFTMGWTEANIARGGTGYIATPENPKGACGLDVCPTFIEMIPDAVKANPDMVIVSGGRNDIGSPDLAFGNAVDKFYSALREALPKAKIVAVNPLWDATAAPAQLARYGEMVKTAVTNVQGTYVDVKQPLQGHSDFMTSDGVHPGDQGYTAIYIAVKNALPANLS